MLDWFKQLDRILRGESTSPQDLREADIRINLRDISFALLILGVVAGLCTGSYAIFHAGGPGWEQFLASGLKVPLLFVLTLVVTFPSLYVFNALVGSRLRLLPVLRLLVASLAVNLSVLASLGPIVAFFGASTPSYRFMVLLNVVTFSIAGVLGLLFLLQTLNRLVAMSEREAAPPPTPAPPEKLQDEDVPADAGDTGQQWFSAEILPEPPSAIEPAAGETLHRHVKTVFGLWIIVFSLVGAQMGWVLRPFIGSPDKPFSFFRERDSNFFEAVFQTILNLFS